MSLLDFLRYSHVALPETERVRTVDPALFVMWDAQREKFVVCDSAAPGGWAEQIVMLVQEPSGGFRPIDERTLSVLRRLRQRGPDAAALIRELEESERARQREVDARTRDLGDGLGSDLKWIGQAVVPSVAWRDRSAARERIRAEAIA